MIALRIPVAATIPSRCRNGITSPACHLWRLPSGFTQSKFLRVFLIPVPLTVLECACLVLPALSVPPRLNARPRAAVHFFGKTE